jgi:hypothetical protein
MCAIEIEDIIIILNTTTPTWIILLWYTWCKTHATWCIQQTTWCKYVNLIFCHVWNGIQYSERHQYIRYYNFLGFWLYVHIIRYISSWNASYKAKWNINWYTNYTADFSDPVGREIKQSLFVTSTLSRFDLVFS